MTDKMKMPETIYVGYKCSPSAWAHTQYWSEDNFLNEDGSMEECKKCKGVGCVNCVRGCIPSCAVKYHHDSIVETLRKERDELAEAVVILNALCGNCIEVKYLSKTISLAKKVRNKNENA